MGVDCRANCFNCKRKLYIFDEIYVCHYCGTPEWGKYFKMASKHQSVKYILCWFDKNILRKLDIDVKKTTLDVRIRIICGLINKNTFLTRDLKIELMELIWQKYKEKSRMHYDWVAQSIYKVPF